MCTLLRQCRMQLLLGHVCHIWGWMHMPKDIFYRRTSIMHKRATGHTRLQYTIFCKRDMTALDVNTYSWENIAANQHQRRTTATTNCKHLAASEDIKLPVDTGWKDTPQRKWKWRLQTHICVTGASVTATPTQVFTATEDRAASRFSSEDATSVLVKIWLTEAYFTTYYYSIIYIIEVFYFSHHYDIFKQLANK